MRGRSIRRVLLHIRKLAHIAMEPPKYVDASRVRKVLKYEDLIPVIEEALANFSARESGGVVQPVRSAVQMEDRGYIIIYLSTFTHLKLLLRKTRNTICRYKSLHGTPYNIGSSGSRGRVRGVQTPPPPLPRFASDLYFIYFAFLLLV